MILSPVLESAQGFEVGYPKLIKITLSGMHNFSPYGAYAGTAWYLSRLLIML